MRVTLATRHSDARFTPLALLYLKAALVDHAGLAPEDISILEFAPEATPDEMASAIAASAPDALALSCYVWNIDAQMKAVAAVKAVRPDVPVVVGGPEVGPIAERTFALYPAVDIVVKSEGETPLVDLVTRWRDGRPIDDVPGIWRRGVGEHPDASIIRQLDSIASPHHRGYVDHTGRIVCMETQRGCVFTCTFCFYNKDFSIRNRRFDLERVKEEIAYWLDQDIKQLYLMDPVFNLNAARAKEICRFIAAHNHRGIPIHAEIWAEFVDDELARLMKAANFGLLEVGLQTTDVTALQIVERRFKMEPFLNGIRALRRHELPFELQLILGLPADTLDTFRESLDFAAALDPEYLVAFVLTVLPGTELWRRAEALKIAFEDEPPYYLVSTPTMDEETVAYAKKVSAVVRALWNSRTIRVLCREQGMTFSKLVDLWIEWRDAHGYEETRDVEKLSMQLDRFVPEHCQSFGITPDLYLGMLKFESRASPRPTPLPSPQA